MAFEQAQRALHGHLRGKQASVIHDESSSSFTTPRNTETEPRSLQAMMEVVDGLRNNSYDKDNNDKNKTTDPPTQAPTMMPTQKSNKNSEKANQQQEDDQDNNDNENPIETDIPSTSPTKRSTSNPTVVPTLTPFTSTPSALPTIPETTASTEAPVTMDPTRNPTLLPTAPPSRVPTSSPTAPESTPWPTQFPTTPQPSASPTETPSTEANFDGQLQLATIDSPMDFYPTGMPTTLLPSTLWEISDAKESFDVFLSLQTTTATVEEQQDFVTMILHRQLCHWGIHLVDSYLRETCQEDLGDVWAAEKVLQDHVTENEKENALEQEKDLQNPTHISSLTDIPMLVWERPQAQGTQIDVSTWQWNVTYQTVFLVEGVQEREAWIQSQVDTAITNNEQWLLEHPDIEFWVFGQEGNPFATNDTLIEGNQNTTNSNHSDALSSMANMDQVGSFLRVIGYGMGSFVIVVYSLLTFFARKYRHRGETKVAEESQEPVLTKENEGLPGLPMTVETTNLEAYSNTSPQRPVLHTPIHQTTVHRLLNSALGDYGDDDDDDDDKEEPSLWSDDDDINNFTSQGVPKQLVDCDEVVITPPSSGYLQKLEELDQEEDILSRILRKSELRNGPPVDKVDPDHESLVENALTKTKPSFKDHDGGCDDNDGTKSRASVELFLDHPEED